MADIGMRIIAGVLVVLLFGAGVGCQVARYRECKAHGFTAFYCLQSH